MNLKKIEREISGLTILIATAREEGSKDEHKKVVKEIMNLFHQTVKQAVESVPAKGYKVKNYKTEKYLEFSDSPSSGETLRRWGYNQHVQEIKQWKKKILKELGGGMKTTLDQIYKWFKDDLENTGVDKKFIELLSLYITLTYEVGRRKAVEEILERKEGK